MAGFCADKDNISVQLEKDWVTAAKGYRAAAQQGLAR
jgi:hypothetical protein